MFKPAVLVAIFLFFFLGQAQEVSLPADLRQHALTQYNASLFNPAFSLDRNNPQSVAFWTRWQWQDVDTDPTTLFLNYSRSLNKNSVAGIGFFQHNTGIYFNTGGALNYAYQIEFNRLIKLSVGANVFGFQQQIADTRFPVTPIPGIPQSIPTDDFILQVAPGFNIQVENFSLSLASENLFDYNFTDNAANTAPSDKIFMGMASYDFPVMASDSTAYIRPSIYLRTIPEQENQIGLNALFSTQKFWIQSGYNNFYGISVGAGGTFFNRFSLGALVEFGTSASLNSKDPSFEIIASYYLGKPDTRRPVVASGILDDTEQVVLIGEDLTNEEIQEELEKAEKMANPDEEETDELEEIHEEKTEEVIEVNPTEEIIDETNAKVDKKEIRRLAAEQKALEKQQRKDSIAEVKKEKEALDLLKKQEEEQAKKDAEEAKKAKELEAEEAKKAAELARAEKLKEQQRQEELKKKRDEETSAEAQRIEQQRRLDSISDVRKAVAIAAELKLKEQQQLDSINEAKRAEAIVEATKLREKQRLDSITRANEAEELAIKKAAEEAAVRAEAAKQIETEVVKPRAGEKYEEVANEDGLEPGYYLIANVFGTKKYFDAFMADLRRKGLQPKSFFRSLNKYNYAYLERYDTISAARQGRDSKFNGQYGGKTWIFRVVGK
ncbi:type IX secretion system membrane protein PorP/SprF [Maribacter algarum]|uniref:Type IX secretion system membrane protein PorP/SprF n=1 Tax=Maribacter algarum (ex Zhang et al. 2020) TaxID=2578118 RepID=A0A5S3PVE1_9FLAO|nr:PorP/SprF family type IX secretion system membrane protein [Maribacter algarum]TMM56928.1 type IX secretion system membrane protein PorP/SprF [Maribacter algarum]